MRFRPSNSGPTSFDSFDFLHSMWFVDYGTACSLHPCLWIGSKHARGWVDEEGVWWSLRACLHRNEYWKILLKFARPGTWTQVLKVACIGTCQLSHYVSFNILYQLNNKKQNWSVAPKSARWFEWTTQWLPTHHLPHAFLFFLKTRSYCNGFRSVVLG